MLKHLRLVLILSFTFSCLQVFAQEGTSLITNYLFGETSIDNESWAMTQDDEEQMLFTNRRGIVSFDGMKWNTILTTSAPLKLFLDVESKQVFMGFKNNIGILVKGDNGIYQYASLIPGKRNVGNIESKNKDEIAMYFVKRIKAKFAEDKDGKIPNETLRKRINL